MTEDYNKFTEPLHFRFEPLRSASKPKKCPSCGSVRIADIMYGFPQPPDEELRKKMDKGEVVLGGCCLTGDDPRWQCLDCKVEIHQSKGS